jgi:thiol-disulfide isomerase/thioredoxin
MNKTIKYKFLMLLIFMGAANSLFAKNINLEVVFPDNLNHQRLSVYYNNGKSDKRITPVIKNNKWVVSDSCYDRYATISFFYRQENNSASVKGYQFWISEKPAKIEFSPILKAIDNPLSKYNVTNAISLDDLYHKKIDLNIQQARLYINKYLTEYSDSFKIYPQKRFAYHAMVDSLALVELKMINLHPDDYYFLYYYFNYIVQVRNSLSAKDQLVFFNKTFSESLKATQLGLKIANTLKSRISSKKGNESPDFSLIDINNKEISSSKLKGKYILLDFWASWCLPCLQLTPQIQKIREEYPQNKLEIISISLDTNYASFLKALKKTNTSFLHIFGNQEIIKNFAVSSIPQYILINPNGQVIYNKEEENDANIEKLKTLLRDSIKAK